MKDRLKAHVDFTWNHPRRSYFFWTVTSGESRSNNTADKETLPSFSPMSVIALKRRQVSKQSTTARIPCTDAALPLFYRRRFKIQTLNGLHNHASTVSTSSREHSYKHNPRQSPPPHKMPTDTNNTATTLQNRKSIYLSTFQSPCT